jgi:hypothetical protein
MLIAVFLSVVVRVNLAITIDLLQVMAVLFTRTKIGDRQIIANIFLNGVEIVPSRSFKGMEGSSGASRTIQPRRMKCDRRD